MHGEGTDDLHQRTSSRRCAGEKKDAEKRIRPHGQSRKQAIAIGLNEAREKGAKVPSRKGSRKSSSGKGARKGSRKSSSKKR